MNAKEFTELEKLLVSKNDGNYLEIADKVYYLLRQSGHLEQLIQLVKNGPIYDGDIISKSKRGDLLALKLAVRCCYKGKQGYTAASYFAFTILNSEKRWFEDQMRNNTR